MKSKNQLLGHGHTRRNLTMEVNDNNMLIISFKRIADSNRDSDPNIYTDAHLKKTIDD
jgi:hypothetical protein